MIFTLTHVSVLFLKALNSQIVQVMSISDGDTFTRFYADNHTKGLEYLRLVARRAASHSVELLSSLLLNSFSRKMVAIKVRKGSHI